MEPIKEVTFIEAKLRDSYESLKEGTFEDRKLFSFITRAMEDLKQHPLAYTRVPKSLIPKEYTKKWGVTSLWKYDLPDGWRLLYIISGNSLKIVSVILEWLDHTEYERRFNY
jgi:hypothetical protein